MISRYICSRVVLPVFLAISETIFTVKVNRHSGGLRRRGCGYLVRLARAFVVLPESPAKTIENRVPVARFRTVQRAFRNLNDRRRIAKFEFLHICCFMARANPGRVYFSKNLEQRLSPWIAPTVTGLDSSTNRSNISSSQLYGNI